MTSSRPPHDPEPSPAADALLVPQGLQDEVLAEDEPPGRGRVLQTRDKKAPHPDRVRMYLAGAMVAILAVIVGVACYGWIMGRHLEDMQALAIVMSPVVTLVGTILGFYFSSERQKGN